MEKPVPYVDKIPSIRSELLKRAPTANRVYYSDLGKLVGIPQAGPWKPVLDLIGKMEADENRPDITYLVVSKTTNYPSQIDFRLAKPPTAAQRQRAEQVWSAISKYYARP